MYKPTTRIPQRYKDLGVERAEQARVEAERIRDNDPARNAFEDRAEGPQVRSGHRSDLWYDDEGVIVP